MGNKKMKAKYKHLANLADKIETGTGEKVTVDDIGLLVKNIAFAYTAKYTYFTSVILKDTDLGLDKKVKKSMFTVVLSLLENSHFNTKIYNTKESLQSYISIELSNIPLGIFEDFVKEVAYDFFVYLFASAPHQLLDIKEYRNFIVDVLKDYDVDIYYVAKPIDFKL